MDVVSSLLDFFVAGVQKAGTTTLHSYLRQHPELCLPAQKELHYFDDEDGVNWQAPNYELLHEHFPRDSSIMRGEATPIYSYWPNALERICRYNPDAKFIIMLRDPVERAWSHWRMERRRGCENEEFGSAIRGARARVAASPNGAHRVHSYVERGCYGSQLRRLLTHFPARNVHISSLAAMETDRESMLASICEFLNVSHFEQPPTPRRLNSDLEPPTTPDPADAEYLRGLYVDEMRDLHECCDAHNIRLPVF